MCSVGADGARLCIGVAILRGIMACVRSASSQPARYGSYFVVLGADCLYVLFDIVASILCRRAGDPQVFL